MKTKHSLSIRTLTRLISTAARTALIAGLLSGLASVGTAQLTPVARYTFDDGTAADISGNNLNGTLFGNATIMMDDVDPDNRGMVLVLDDFVEAGNPDGSTHVRISDPSQLLDFGPDNTAGNTGSATVAAWVYNDGSGWTVHDPIFNQGEWNDGIGLAIKPDNDNELWTGKSGAQTLRSDVGVPTGEWVHVAATWDFDGTDTTVTFYINGDPVGYAQGDPGTITGQVVSPIDNDGDGLGDSRIGLEWRDTTPGNARWSFNGRIDDLQIFNFALTEQDIEAVMAGLSQEELPPRITDLSPADGFLFHPVDGGVGFSVTTVDPNTLPASAVQLFLDDGSGEVDVSGSLNVTGDGTQDLTVSYTGALNANKIYTARAVVQDNMSRESSRTWTFDTFDVNAGLVVEAEDYNYGPNECDPIGDPVGDFTTGGQYLQDPVPSFFNGETSSYVNQAEGYVDRVGVPDVDYHDTASRPTDPNVNVYRFCDVVGTQSTNDSRRQKYIDASDAAGVEIPDFVVSQLQAGEWLNYTRMFEASEGKYRVYLRVSATADQIVRLDKVTSDPSAGGQETSPLGSFNVQTEGVRGFQYVPLTDLGNEVVLALSGEETLRLTTPTADDDINLNYLFFLPTDEPVSVIGPIAEKVVPEPDSTEAFRDRIAVTILNRETSLNVDSVALFVDDSEVSANVTPNADGADVSYTPAFDPGTEHTARLDYSDDEGNDFSFEWSFTTSSDVDGPLLTFTAASSGSLTLRVYFDEPVDEATAVDLDNYSSSGGVTFDSATFINDRAVELTSSATVAEGEINTLTVNGVTDVIGNPIAMDSMINYNPSRFVQNEGILVVEAESYHEKVPAADGQHEFRHTFVEDYAGGGAMQTDEPDTNTGGAPGDTTRMDYRVTFTQAGTYKVWIRGISNNGGDSFHFGVDGANFGGITGIDTGAFNWDDNLQGGTGDGVIDVTEGDHTINVWMREDSSILDRFMFVLVDNDFDPSTVNDGVGPDQSPQVGDPIAPAVSITSPADGAIFDSGSDVEITAEVTDPDSATHVVEFFVNGESVGQADAEPYSITVAGLADGNYQLSAVATDPDNLTGTSPEVGILVGRPSVIQVTNFSFEDPAQTADDTEVYSTEDIGPGWTREVVTTDPDISGQNFGVQNPAVDYFGGVNPLPAPFDGNQVGFLNLGNGVGNTIQLVSGAVTTLEEGDTITLRVAVGTRFTSTWNVTYEIGLRDEDGVELGTFTSETIAGPDNRIEDLQYVLHAEDAPDSVGKGLHIVIRNINQDAGFGQGNFDNVRIQFGEPPPPPESGLVAHYTFDDGTANDSSGNGNHGTLAGTAAIVDDPVQGSVLSLDGGGKVDLGDPVSMQIEGEITVAAWINIMGGSGNRNIVNKGHDDSGLPTGYRREFTMRVDGSDPANYDFGTWESGRDPGDQNATIPVPDEDLAGTWVHLAGTAVFDSETSTYTWNLYRNGVLVNTSEPFDTGMFPVNFGWAIGARGGVDDVQRGFVGMIDDVRIYDRALSAREIAALASRIIWINEVESESGQEYQDLLKNAGYQVTERMFTDPTPEEQTELNAADLVIVSRKTNSGTYNNQTWDETVTTPLILMTPYLARNSRWVWVDGTSIVNVDSTVAITADAPEHPLFDGMDTTGGTAGFWYTDPIDRGTNINGPDPILDGGTLLASQNGNIISAEWPAGSVAVGPRLLFNSGSQEPSGGTTADSGKYDLTETGAMAFLNAVAYMIGQGGATGPGGPAFDSIVLNGNGTISISWTGSATLESSASVTGPYAPVADAASPYTVDDPQGTLFFRLVP